jgi:CheY-like chemotaxis protein
MPLPTDPNRFSNPPAPALPSRRILAVDDEPFYLRLIGKYLAPAGYDVVCAASGAEALELLSNSEGDGFDAMLLDRGIPDIDGLEILARVKSDPGMRDLPVIMQTGLAEPQQVAEGMNRGAFYYLSKPFSSEVLLAIVAAAVNDYKALCGLREQLLLSDSGRALLRRGEYACRTLAEVKTLSAHLAQYFPEPSRVVHGISEFLLNAIEHGNLALDYDDKSELLRAGKWLDEVERRLQLPENIDKRVRVLLDNAEDRVSLTVIDEGKGFDWCGYMDLDPARAFDLHGRGIALSRLMSFDSVEFRGAGNEVVLSSKRHQ